jgi:hypothetical protein
VHVVEGGEGVYTAVLSVTGSVKVILLPFQVLLLVSSTRACPLAKLQGQNTTAQHGTAENVNACTMHVVEGKGVGL